MRIFHPLRDRKIALLFVGQVLSYIGDEVYNVAVVWFAVSFIGEKAGYISALQAGSVLVFSLMGGIWADHWSHHKTLIWSDIARGVVVLIPVFLSPFFPLSLTILIPVVILESSFTGLFNPAIRALIPEIVKERSLLNATNGLMEGTIRLGRVIGPGVVAVLGKGIPLIHFFTINAITFFSSAISIGKIGHVEQLPTPKSSLTRWEQVKEGLLSGARLAFSHPPLKFTILTGILSTPTWYLVMPLSMALLVHEKMPNNYSALGLFISAYGVGNVIGNLWAGSVLLNRPNQFLSWGRVIAGVGFLAMAFTSSLPWMMFTGACAAFGGPVTDLGMLAIVQNKYRGKDAARVFRFHLAFFHSMILIAYALSPFLYQTFGVSRVIGGCGCLIALSGALGVFFPKP